MDGKAIVNIYLELKNRAKSGFDQAKKHINQNVQDIKDRISSLKDHHIKGFSAMQEQLPGFGSAIGLLKNPFVLVTAAVVALGGAFAKASDIADDFDRKMAKANTTAQESPEQLKKSKDMLGGMAAKSNLKDAHQFAPQAYDVMLSSGLDRDTSLKSVPSILKASKATDTAPEVVARATSGVMNSTGIKDSNVVLDKMAMVKNKGNAEFADIANYLPKIIPAANNAGVSIDDVGGSFAYLTAMGLKSEQAATGLENAFKTLADPDKAKAFKNIGVDFYDSAGKMKPMLDIAGQLKTALTGLTDKQKATVLETLGLDTESASAFAILTKDTEKLKGAIDGVTNATGELQRQSDAAAVPMDSWVQIGNAVTEGWRRLGDVVNQVLGPIGSWISGVFDSLQNGTNMFSPVLEGIGSIFTGIWSIITSIGSAIWAIIEPVVSWMQKSAIIQDIFWLIGKIGGIIGNIISAIGTVLGKVGEAIGWVFNHTIKPIMDSIEWMYNKVKAFFGLKSDDSKVAKAKEALGGVTPETPKPETPKPPADMYHKPNEKVQNVLDKAKSKENKEAGMSGGSQSKVITVNKLSIVDGNFITNNAEFANMDKNAFEKYMMEFIQRAFINLARSYG